MHGRDSGKLNPPAQPKPPPKLPSAAEDKRRVWVIGEQISTGYGGGGSLENKGQVIRQV